MACGFTFRWFETQETIHELRLRVKYALYSNVISIGRNISIYWVTPDGRRRFDQITLSYE